LITGCGTTLGPITTGGVTVTVGPATGPVTNVTMGGVGPTTTGLGTVPLGPTTNCGGVGVCGCGPTVNGTGKLVGSDNFTTSSFGGSVVVPPPQAVNTVTNNSDAIFLMRVFLYIRKLLKKKLSKQALEFGNSVLIFFKSQRYLSCKFLLLIFPITVIGIIIAKTYVIT
jgi:hypothetical protein